MLCASVRSFLSSSVQTVRPILTNSRGRLTKQVWETYIKCKRSCFTLLRSGHFKDWMSVNAYIFSLTRLLWNLDAEVSVYELPCPLHAMACEVGSCVQLTAYLHWGSRWPLSVANLMITWTVSLNFCKYFGKGTHRVVFCLLFVYFVSEKFNDNLNIVFNVLQILQ
jgi:hypothetical protein